MGLRHSYSDFWRRRWGVRSTRRSGRRWGWCCCVVGLSMNKSSDSTTSRAGQPGASEGEDEDDVEATHFGCGGIVVW